MSDWQPWLSSSQRPFCPPEVLPNLFLHNHCPLNSLVNELNHSDTPSLNAKEHSATSNTIGSLLFSVVRWKQSSGVRCSRVEASFLSITHWPQPITGLCYWWAFEKNYLTLSCLVTSTSDLNLCLVWIVALQLIKPSIILVLCKNNIAWILRFHLISF